jgi:hypothetical protein
MSKAFLAERVSILIVAYQEEIKQHQPTNQPTNQPTKAERSCPPTKQTEASPSPK